MVEDKLQNEPPNAVVELSEAKFRNPIQIYSLLARRSIGN